MATVSLIGDIGRRVAELRQHGALAHDRGIEQGPGLLHFGAELLVPHDFENGSPRFRHEEAKGFCEPDAVGPGAFGRRDRVIVKTPLEKLADDDFAHLRGGERIVCQQAEMNLNRFLSQAITHGAIRERLCPQKCEFESDPIGLVRIEQSNLKAGASVTGIGQPVEDVFGKSRGVGA